VTETAARGLERCRHFLASNNPQAMRRAGQAIATHFQLLETAPDMGRPLPELPELRELLIGFGDSGYISLYRFDATVDAVFILAFRHQKEAGYQA
jgi:plasmid stabilization system protein ParE